MNFNLISPENEGHHFTTRFQEEIEIKKDSSIYLNFAKLQRDVRIILDNTNFVDLELVEPIPFRNTAGGEAYPQNTADRRITIPAGTYSVQDLQQLISLGTQEILNQGIPNVGTLKNNMANMYNAGIVDINPFQEENAGTDLMKLSVERNIFGDDLIVTPTNNEGGNRLEIEDFEESGTHKVNSGQIGTEPASYRKTTAGAGNLTYDNYAIDDRKLWHYNVSMTAWENYSEGISTGTANTRNTDAEESTDTDRQLENYSYISFRTAKNAGDIRTELGAANTRGGNFVGLYSANYATATPANGGNNLADQGFVQGARTTGGTLETFTKNGFSYPLCHFAVEIGSDASNPAINGAGGEKIFANIFLGSDGTNNISNCDRMGNRIDPAPFPHMGKRITDMNLRRSVEITTDDVDDDEKIEVIILPLFKQNPRQARKGTRNTPYDGFVNRRELHFQVIVRSSNENKGDSVIYDSLGNDRENDFIAGEMMDGYEVAFGRPNNFNALTENEITIQYPWNVICASKDDPASGTGFGLMDIHFGAIPRKFSNQNLFPTIIDGLRYKFSGELGSVVAQEARKTTATRTSAPIYPSLRSSVSGFFNLNPLDNNPNNLDAVYAGLLYLNSLYQQGELQSYSVYINNIPLRNYKNRIIDLGNKGQAGGIKKNLLKSLPIPFYSGFTTAQIGNERICSYEPANKEISELKNQTFKTNNFTIEIRDLETDRPATDIKHAVINFTIAEKDSKLIN